jgi:BirA family biotin operon repressor/biotin-[acetyl-CoA-carboxylase] ligase
MTFRVQWYDDVASTNDIALAAAEADVAEGLVIAADRQTRGRGRLGRAWSSPSGAGLYASILLRPPAAVLPLLTLACGVAVADAVEIAAGVPLALKWPNDACVWREDRWLKVAGILTEAGVSGSGRHYAVVGIGINVRPGAHESDVQQRATDLKTECGRDVDRASLLTHCLAAIETRYRQLQDSSSGRHGLLDAWRERATATLGRAVEWDSAGTTIRGTADDLDGEGALLIRTATGLVRVTAGEVRWI